MEQSSAKKQLEELKRKGILICTIRGDEARLLEVALDKGMGIKFEKDDENGDIRLLAE